MVCFLFTHNKRPFYITLHLLEVDSLHFISVKRELGEIKKLSFNCSTRNEERSSNFDGKRAFRKEKMSWSAGCKF